MMVMGVADALQSRAARWFIDPARRLAEDSPFASGLITVCLADAAAEFRGTGFVDWLHHAVPASAAPASRKGNKTVAEPCRDDVRNGLAHHARLNQGAEFSTQSDQPLGVAGGVLIVDPAIPLLT